MIAMTPEVMPAQNGPYGSIYLKNYKSFGPSGQSLPLSRINLFFGPNSSGKSSVFKAIRLAINAFNGESLSEYKYSTTVHKGKKNEQIVIGLCFRHPHGDIDSTPHLYFHFSERPGDCIGLCQLDVVLPSRMVLQLRQEDDGLHLVGMEMSTGDFRKILPATLKGIEESALSQHMNHFKETISLGHFPLDTFFSNQRFLSNVEAIPDEITNTIDGMIAKGLYVVRDNLGHLSNNLIHLPPIRKVPSRSQLLAMSQSETDFLSDVEARTWEVLLTPRFEHFLKEINFWMSEKCLDLGYELIRKNDTAASDMANARPNVNDPGYLVVRDTTDPLMNTVELDLTDVGVGISQVIPVIGAACVHNELWIMIEQPELHLHPQVQCRLADLFIAKSKDELFLGNANSGNVFFIETHSEHLVLRMLRRVRETGKLLQKPGSPLALSPDDVSVFYFEPKKMTGGKIHRMRITADGDFDDVWPNGFFSERLRELR